MSRTTAREVALKIVFELCFQEEKSDVLYERYLKTVDEDDDISQEDEDFILDVINGIEKESDAIDERIKTHLKDWSFSRISKVDLSILRLAIYEILYRDDIPFKVSINEAVELSKSFGDDSSPSFINGVLAEIVKEIQ